jgi:predicted thioesterase
MTDTIKPGLVMEDTQPVNDERVASHVGSGSLKVYATPAMVTFVEHTCRRLVEGLLPEGQTTVGTMIKVEHLAPTPLGAEVHIRAKVAGVDGRRVHFAAELWDAVEVIGRAEHTRVIIDTDRFLDRVSRKST